MVKYFRNKLLSRRYITAYGIEIKPSCAPVLLPFDMCCHLSIPIHDILEEGPARPVHGMEERSQSEGRSRSRTHNDAHG
jgi:hypothetical protein